MTGLLSAHADPRIKIILDPEDPSQSFGELHQASGEVFLFPVGFGRNGILPEGSRFQGGYTLLGEFQVNAVLSMERFVMTPDLVRKSGKTEDELRTTLFANMSAIDFDGDGEGKEYGAAYISLEPLSDAAQPFHFGNYKGRFRWYSFALHGTQDESRIGKAITGGCVNLGQAALRKVLESIELGDRVLILTRQD